MRLPPRKEVGSLDNFERVQVVITRLAEIGEEYRCIVPKKERSYRKWLEFLQAREPLLVGMTNRQERDAQR